MFLRLASLALWIAVIPLSQALAIPATSPGGVLYSLDNDARGAMIVAMSLSSNGTIVDTNMISTGGKGLVGTTGPGQPPVGNLFGADSVVVEDNVRSTFHVDDMNPLIALTDMKLQFIFTVNPGSNTLSMFSINPQSPMQPTLVGRPVNTLGQFPMSLTYSSALRMGKL